MDTRFGTPNLGTQRELRISLLKDLGDFQTPHELAETIADLFTCHNWGRVLEPTCGTGNFIRALSSRLPASCEIQGIELQARYVGAARGLARTGGVAATIHQGSIFDFDLSRDLRWNSSRKLLVLGNPPWVTNSELGSLGSINLPKKENLKGLSGLDALTRRIEFRHRRIDLAQVATRVDAAKTNDCATVQNQRGS